MVAFRSLLVPLAVVAAVLACVPIAGRRGAVAAVPASDGVLARGKIRTVVVVVMENRTFDNIFGGDRLAGHPTPFPDADALVDDRAAPLMTTAPFAPDSGADNWHNTFACLQLGNFSVAQWQKVATAGACPVNGWPQPLGIAPFKYLAPQNRTVYAEIATKYRLSDRFFAVTSTDSFPAHQYIVAGKAVYSSDGSDVEIVGGAPNYTAGGANGCADHKSVQFPVPLVPTPAPGATPSVQFTQQRSLGINGECYDGPTFADAMLMTVPAVSFQHYKTEDDSGLFNGFANIRTWWNKPWPLSKNAAIADASAGRLPNFSWIKPPCANASDHPNLGNAGPSWVKDVVNAIGGNSAQWAHTAVFIVWDDWGGFYDHAVPPPQRPWDNLGPGMRTPLLLLSPYARDGHVIHGVATYGSILRFAEDLYGIPSLNAVDANSPDLTGYFDFSASPRPFVPITAPAQPSWVDVCGIKRIKPLTRD